jgi:hypothetical protein
MMKGMENDAALRKELAALGMGGPDGDDDEAEILKALGKPSAGGWEDPSSSSSSSSFIIFEDNIRSTKDGAVTPALLPSDRGQLVRSVPLFLCGSDARLSSSCLSSSYR